MTRVVHIESIVNCLRNLHCVEYLNVHVLLVRVVTIIVVMSWPLLLGGLLLSASLAMSGSIRPGYSMIPMSYPPNSLPYSPKMLVNPLRANRTLNRLSNPEHDPKLLHKRYSRRVQEEIKRRTEAMMRRNSPSMKKIRARIALLGMVTIIVLHFVVPGFRTAIPSCYVMDLMQSKILIS